MTRQTSPLALAVLALMALALAVPWFAPGPAAGWRQWQPPAPQAPNLDDVKAAVLQFNPAAASAYPVVLERPLLFSSRRPEAPASAASAPAAPPPTAIEQVTMQGILAGPTLTGVFLAEDGQSRFVRRGEKVGDWTLDAIDGRHVVFKRGGEQRRIELLPAQPDQGKAQEQDRNKASRSAPPPGNPAPAAAQPPGRQPAAPADQPTSRPAVPAPAQAASGARRGGFGGGGRVARPPAESASR